jgi:hypothetical protein
VSLIVLTCIGTKPRRVPGVASVEVVEALTKLAFRLSCYSIQTHRRTKVITSRTSGKDVIPNRLSMVEKGMIGEKAIVAEFPISVVHS